MKRFKWCGQTIRAAIVFEFAVALASSGCTVRTGMGVPLVVAGARPPRQAATQPARHPTPPPQQQYAQPQVACVDPGDRDLPDLFDHPTPVDATSTTVGCTHRGDGDLFVVTAPPGAAGHVLRYRLTGQVEMAPKLEIFNANRRRIDQAFRRKREELAGWIHMAGGTQVLLRVTQLHGVQEAYSLVLQTTPLDDPTEPNDSPPQATPLAAGTSRSGFMSNPANDEAAISDWYQLEVSNDGELAVEVDMSQDIAGIAILHDTHSRRRIKQQVSGRGERFRLETPVRRGSYHLELKSVHRVEECGQGEPPPRLTRPYTISIVQR